MKAVDFSATVGAAIDRGRFTRRIDRPSSRADQCEALRAYYRAAWQIVRTKPAHVWAIDPYEIDWQAVFSPIEQAMWADIRAEGMVLYPQHPVGRFFVDFGNPVARVALECDGARWHAERKQQDLARQREIEARGWRVFRVTGSECFHRNKAVIDEETGEEIVAPTAAQYLLRMLAADYGLSARAAGHSPRAAA